jgi:DNA-binding NtrC family response regulator/ligand-binding sensor domain-containing protein
VDQNLALDKTVSIEGTLLMLDDSTPHVAVPVQVIQNGKVIATTLSDERGKYQFVNLKRERYQMRCHVLGRYVYYGEGGSTVTDGSRAVFLQVKDGVIRDNTDFRFAPFKKGTWRSYTALDGLANSFVYAMYAEPGGVMWFGTFGGGVSRYDGNTFVNFTTEDGLAGDDVLAIQGDSDGALWFGTLDGVSRYDGTEFVTFTTEDGLAANAVSTIYCDDDGVLWFGTGYWGHESGGVSRYDGKRFVNFSTKDGLPDDFIWSIYHDPHGVLWFGTWGGGVCRYDGKEFRNFTTKDGLADNRILAIHCDRDGIMWFGAWEGGFSRYDGKEFVSFTREDGLVDDSVCCSIHSDPDGTLWFGTHGGVSRYDGKGFVNLATEDGLPAINVHDIRRDSDGTMWFTTGYVGSVGGGGVSRYDVNTFVNLTTRDGLADNSISAIYRDPDGVMWFGTNGGGVSRYDGKEFRNFAKEDGLADNYVWGIHRDPDGVLWFGTRTGGVSRYDGKEFVNFTKAGGWMNNQVAAVHGDPDGTIWFGTVTSGVSRYDGKEFRDFTKDDGLASNCVWAIHRGPDGALWFGTDGGISRYDGETFVNLTTDNGLANNCVHAIHHDSDGALWFGTRNGVSRYDGKEFVNFTTRDGLGGNYVTAIHQSSDGTLWFGTEGSGVSRYDGIAWSSLDMRDGLAGNSVFCIHQHEDGYLWFGTDGGLTRYRGSDTPPKATIASVRTDEEYADLRTIPPITTGNRVTIRYGAIDFKTLPEKRQYRCRIYEAGGNDSVSPYLPPTKEISFDWIPEKPGTYIFQVQAIDRDLNYSEPATLSLTVQPDPQLVEMQSELNHLRREVRGKYHFENIIGQSTSIKQIHALMEKAIDSGLTVLISGETGTGKELVAKAIHYNSRRKDKPLQELNCGAIPRDLVASTLFGHRKGAFTGASEDRTGLFEIASGGTMLLDEVGEMPEEAQIHLLRVLQEHKIQRIGETELRDVDVRIIAITNRDLEDEVEAGRFREDLYYRLSVFPIYVPPLREHVDDVQLLARHFLQQACRQQDKELQGFAPGVLDMLLSYPWPGNVRELEHEVYRAVALAEEGSRIQTYHFSPKVTRGESLIQEVLSDQVSYRELVDRFRRRVIEKALRENDGNRSAAARQLRIDRSNLVAVMKRLGIE